MKKELLLSVLTLALLLASCAQPAASPTPTEAPAEPTTTVEPTRQPTAVEGDVITKEAMVESIEILLLESFPIQVSVVARGNLPDSCTEISEITKERDGDTFRVTITTSRPADAMCAAVLVPFEEVISLDVLGLPAGVYTVNVNGVSDTFTLDVDNVPPEGEAPSAGLPNPAAVYCEEQGYTVEIRTDESGGQYGVCVFPDGSECEEWAFYRGECGPATTTEGALMVSELLESPEYDTEVKVYGQVSLLGEMLCPCFELTSGGKTVLVWYGLMVEDDGTERPAVSMGDILPHKCGIDLFGVIHAAKHSLLMTDYLRPTSEGVTHNQDRQQPVLI